jgi:tetratricopeptide (TPR) repeat protein
MKLTSLLLIGLALLIAAGCKPKVRQSSDFERKQAANLTSEAEFAIQLRDFARAEPLFDQATQLCPDIGAYWIKLGFIRVRMGDKSKAKTAYEGALNAFRAAYAADPKLSDVRLQEVYALALLGRVDEARAALDKAQKQLPDNTAIRGFIDNKQLDHMLADPGFKQASL